MVTDAGRIESTTDGGIWRSWCEAAQLDDIFYDWTHVTIWAREWSCEAVGVRYEDPHGVVLLAVLRDPLDGLEQGAGRCDVKTPYDFGGPVGAPDALPGFSKAWDGLLREWGAVTEFQRLHPFRFVDPLAQLPGVAKHADNFVVDLSPGYDAIRAAYKQSWRRGLRKAERRVESGELSARVVQDPTAADVAVFARLYDQTMAGVGAQPWYLFSRATFEALFAHPAIAMVRVDAHLPDAPDVQPAAVAMSLRSGDDRFYHLGASEWSLRGMFPNNLLHDTLVRHALDEGCQRVHVGGGAASLRRFKSGLANTDVPYFVRKRVLDPDALARICTANALDPDAAFPPWLGRT